MDREYVLCSEGHKAFRVPGEKFYYCSECELKFTSEDKPLIDSKNRVADVNSEKEEERMSKKAECKGCGKVRTIIARGLCFMCYKKAREDEGNPLGSKKKNNETTKREDKPMAVKKRKYKKRRQLENKIEKSDACNNCIHKSVCGITPSCPDFMPIKS